MQNLCGVRKAFTLVELLLVVAIMGILAAVTMPNLARSLRGNRIRIATRAVVTAGRYARNISILREDGHALVFDIDRGKVYVGGAVTALPTNAVPDTVDLEEVAFDKPAVSNVLFVADRAFAGSGEFSRDLDGVTIESVELSDGTKRTSGTAAVVFESNGRCSPYIVILADEAGKRVLIDVDALACVETKEML